MIGHEDENEEVLYKVADKRKFNADGSLRELCSEPLIAADLPFAVSNGADPLSPALLFGNA